jgi:hypothetical protein
VLCPHPGILVGGRCYFCCKQAALNGSRAKLSVDQLAFVGFVSEVEGSRTDTVRGTAWLQPTNPSNIDQQLEELERLRDITPNWITLARRIAEDDGAKS